jgi:hypothetical protein
MYSILLEFIHQQYKVYIIISLLQSLYHIIVADKAPLTMHVSFFPLLPSPVHLPPSIGPAAGK